jgi:group I intron endonuclease
MSQTLLGGNSNTIGYLYRITNNVNGMQYIGVSKHPAKRFKKHCTKPATHKKSLLGNAIQKYGADKFALEVLVQSTMEYCFDLEIKAIEALETRTPSGYNITAGGEGFAGFFGEDHHMYGVKRSQEFCDHMSKLFTGRPIPLEQRAKISASLTGTKQSAETIEKRTKAITGLKRSEEAKQNMRGWKMSEEGRDKIRQAKLGSKAAYIATPEHKKAQADRMKALWADPVFKAQRIANMNKNKEIAHVC